MLGCAHECLAILSIFFTSFLTRRKKCLGSAICQMVHFQAFKFGGICTRQLYLYLATPNVHLGDDEYTDIYVNSDTVAFHSFLIFMQMLTRIVSESLLLWIAMSLFELMSPLLFSIPAKLATRPPQQQIYLDGDLSDFSNDVQAHQQQYL